MHIRTSFFLGFATLIIAAVFIFFNAPSSTPVAAEKKWCRTWSVHRRAQRLRFSLGCARRRQRNGFAAWAEYWAIVSIVYTRSARLRRYCSCW